MSSERTRDLGRSKHRWKNEEPLEDQDEQVVLYLTLFMTMTMMIWCAMICETLLFLAGGRCWELGAENANDRTNEYMWRVSGNVKTPRRDDPWQLGLQQAAAMWAERPDPGIRGSSSDGSNFYSVYVAALRPGLGKDKYSSVVMTQSFVPYMEQGRMPQLCLGLILPCVFHKQVFKQRSMHIHIKIFII